MADADTNHPLELRCSIAVFRDDTVLLVRSTDDGSEVWKLPGGHLGSDEDMFGCALRGLREETGLQADVLSCAFLLETQSKETGRRVVELVMLAPSGIQGEPTAREAGQEPRFVPMAQIRSLKLVPPVASQLHALFGHDDAHWGPYPDLLREKHEAGPN